MVLALVHFQKYWLLSKSTVVQHCEEFFMENKYFQSKVGCLHLDQIMLFYDTRNQGFLPFFLNCNQEKTEILVYNRAFYLPCKIWALDFSMLQKIFIKVKFYLCMLHIIFSMLQKCIICSFDQNWFQVFVHKFPNTPTPQLTRIRFTRISLT